MTPRVTERTRYCLVGMDFFGNPYEKGGGWSEQSAIGQLWQRFSGFCEKGKSRIRELCSEAGFELWCDVEGVTDKSLQSIFVGMQVASLAEIPLELVGKMLPETRYAVFTLAGERIKSDWAKIWEWLPEAGHTKSYEYLIEYYDPARFKGLDDPASEIDFMIPIE